MTCRDPFHTDAPKLPYPTPTRLQLARDIADPEVRFQHYSNWVGPLTIRLGHLGLKQQTVTAQVAELVAAALAEFVPEGDLHTVRLTPAGYAWAGITPDGAA